MDHSAARAALSSAIAGVATEIATKLDGLRLFHGSYVDLVVAAETERGPVTLVAGTHTENFPYFGAAPWDNCLLYLGGAGGAGGAGYTFTGRETGASLAIDFDRDAETATGSIRFSGAMRRAFPEASGEPVQIDLQLPITTRRFAERRLGEAYNVLMIEGLVGMHWNPWELCGEGGTLRIGGEAIELRAARGSAEQGALTNLRAEELALRYDYVAVAKPGERGYGLIHLAGHALHPSSVVGELYDTYLAATTKATLTLSGGELEEGNPRGIIVPPPEDGAVLLFEDVVELGEAKLRRQMIRTRDASGDDVFGLREIFVPRPT